MPGGALDMKAGRGLRAMCEQYAHRLLFYGNIDARALAGTREEFEAEIEAEIVGKFEFAREHGRYIFHSDHSVPHSVLFKNYAYAMEVVNMANGA